MTGVVVSARNLNKGKPWAQLSWGCLLGVITNATQTIWCQTQSNQAALGSGLPGHQIRRTPHLTVTQSVTSNIQVLLWPHTTCWLFLCFPPLVHHWGDSLLPYSALVLVRVLGKVHRSHDLHGILVCHLTYNMSAPWHHNVSMSYHYQLW